MQHFRHCLLGNKVILSSDHHSLKWLNPFRRTEETLTRWIETLSECPWYKVHPLSYRWSLIHTHTEASNTHPHRGQTVWLYRAADLVGRRNNHGC